MLNAERGRLEFAASMVNNFLVLFLIAALLGFAFYLGGTQRGFTERTQVLLLRVVFASALILLILDSASTALHIAAAVINKKLKRLALLVLYVVVGGTAVALMYFAATVLVLHVGNIS